MEKGNIIIIEGPQGSGKTTLSNFLRDNLPCSNLYRLTGIKDKSISGLNKVKHMYLSLINYMSCLDETELNLIFDRTFFTDEVYSNLKYKEYDFHEAYEKILKKFSELDFNIYFVVLYLKNTDSYEKRIDRLHHQYQKFSVKNSVDQQNAYLKLCDEIKYKNIKKIKLEMDDFDLAYKKLINTIPVLKENIKL